jgi:PPOX class probable F420-dependent enzyme
MPDPACPADSSDQQEGADGGYFAPLTSARHLRITTFDRHGIPVSAPVPGVVDGDRAYFRARNRSGTAKRVRHADAVQATPCGALGFFTYGPPLDALARRLSGDWASLAAAKLDSRYPLRRRFPVRLLRRQAVYYELVPAEAPGDKDSTADVPASPIIRVHIRQETRCADATTPTSLATVRMP